MVFIPKKVILTPVFCKSMQYLPPFCITNKMLSHHQIDVYCNEEFHHKMLYISILNFWYLFSIVTVSKKVVFYKHPFSGGKLQCLRYKSDITKQSFNKSSISRFLYFANFRKFTFLHETNILHFRIIYV